MAGPCLSAFSSVLGAVHGFPSPISFNVRSSASTVHPCETSTYPDLPTAFENRLATDLQHLIFSDEKKCSYLSARWLQQAVDVICLSAYSRAEELFPLHIRQVLDLHKACNKWVNRYLEDTISLLDVCNVVKNRISRITHCQQFLQIAIHCLDGAESMTEIQFWRARSSLANWLSAMNMRAEERSELKKCKSLLKRMGQRSANDPSGASYSNVGEFAKVMNTCRATTVFFCGAVVAALSFEPCKKKWFPLLANNKFRGQSGSWPSAFLNIGLPGMKEEMERRESKRASAVLLEVGMADEAARRLYSLLDKFLKSKSFPLSKDDTVELKQSLAELKRSSDDLKNGMAALDKQMNGLFRSIITCRMTLLDMLTYSQL